MPGGAAPKRMKGTAKVAFIAHRDAIEAELDAGWPIKAVYQKRADKLGMSYQQFARYVGSIIREGRQSVLPAIPAPRPKPAPATRQPSGKPPLPSSDPVKESAHARHEPTFAFDGNPRADDEARLIGGAARKPKQ